MKSAPKRDVPLHFSLRQTPDSGSSSQRWLTQYEIASLGEHVASQYLTRLGYRLICANWRSGRFGEIDLVVQSADGLLVFVEVKTRKGGPHAQFHSESAYESINWRKRRKILISIQSYLARNHQQSASVRIDVIVIQYESSLGPPNPFSGWLLHIEDAFQQV